MIIPVRCFTCNRILASKYNKYEEIISQMSNQENVISGDPNIEEILKGQNIYQQAFVKVGVSDRYCCKRHLLTHIDLIHKI